MKFKKILIVLVLLFVTLLTFKTPVHAESSSSDDLSFELVSVVDFKMYKRIVIKSINKTSNTYVLGAASNNGVLVDTDKGYSTKVFSVNLNPGEENFSFLIKSTGNIQSVMLTYMHMLDSSGNDVETYKSYSVDISNIKTYDGLIYVLATLGGLVVCSLLLRLLHKRHGDTPFTFIGIIGTILSFGLIGYLLFKLYGIYNSNDLSKYYHFKNYLLILTPSIILSAVFITFIVKSACNKKDIKEIKKIKFSTGYSGPYTIEGVSEEHKDKYYNFDVDENSAIAKEQKRLNQDIYNENIKNKKD